MSSQSAPQSAPAYGGSRALQSEEIPPVPTQTAPHKSHLQAGGTLQPPHFLSHLSRACQGRKFRGLQLQRLLATLVPRAPCKPQKRKSELRPDLPMLTNIDYHGCGVRGDRRTLRASALAHHRAGRCNFRGKTDTHTHTHLCTRQ